MSEAATLAMQTRRYLRAVVSLALCFALLATSGCREKPTTVSGKVTVDSRPLSNSPDTRGTVVFQPNGGQGAVATALLEPSGQYNLAVGSSMAIPPGNYDVAISISKPLNSEGDGEDPGAEFIAPRKYASAQDSGLKAIVTPGENHIDFNLSSKADEVTQ